MSYPLITLCGSYNLSKDWVLPCVDSWCKISNIDTGNFHVIPDGHLSEVDAKKFEELNFKVVSTVDQNKVTSFLDRYPNLKKIREHDITWRKLLDTAILFSKYEKLVLIDTDVFINKNIQLPEGAFDITYMREDIPAYRANWKIVWQQKMVPALNAGLVILNPKIIDFEYLEFITEKYLINCKDYWWTEQAAWSCLAGKSNKRMLFYGGEVKVLGGFQKRNAKQINLNTYKYIGSNKIIDNFEDFKPLLKGSLIVHFAGLGKRWFKESIEYLSSEPAELTKRAVIMSYPEQKMSLLDKIMISLRLYFKEF